MPHENTVLGSSLRYHDVENERLYVFVFIVRFEVVHWPDLGSNVAQGWIKVDGG